MGSRKWTRDAQEFAWPEGGWPLCKQMFMQHSGDMMLASIYFCLFALPLVTIPAALTALSGLMMRMLMDRPMNSIWAEFWDLFKSNFKDAMIAGWLWLLALLISVVAVSFYGSNLGQGVFFTLLLVMAALVTAILMMAGFYLFPMLAVLDLGKGDCLKNALLLAMARIHWNVLTLLLVLLLGGLVILLLPFSLIFFFVFFAALLNFFSTFFAYQGLRKYVIK